MPLPTIPVVLPKRVLQRVDSRSDGDLSPIQSRKASVLLRCASEAEFSAYCTGLSIVQYGYTLTLPFLGGFFYSSSGLLLQLVPPAGQPQLPGPDGDLTTIQVNVQTGWTWPQMRDGIIAAINAWVNRWAPSWSNYEGMQAVAVPTAPAAPTYVEWFMPYGPKLVDINQGTFNFMEMTNALEGVDVPLFFGQFGPNKAVMAPMYQPLVNANPDEGAHTGPLPMVWPNIT